MGRQISYMTLIGVHLTMHIVHVYNVMYASCKRTTISILFAIDWLGDAGVHVDDPRVA